MLTQAETSLDSDGAGVSFGDLATHMPSRQHE